VPGAQSDDTDRFRRERRRVGPSADRGPRAPRVEESVETDPALHAEERSPGNLPLELTSFIGRKKELAALKGLLAGQLLLTLTGPGGSGKTRLALAVALEMVEGFEDGAWWVGLASLSDSALVAQAVASVLVVRETPGRSLIEALVENLKPKEVRLILENCEHLIDACADRQTTTLLPKPAYPRNQPGGPGRSRRDYLACAPSLRFGQRHSLQRARRLLPRPPVLREPPSSQLRRSWRRSRDTQVG
jgi:hypothetical protein